MYEDPNYIIKARGSFEDLQKKNENFAYVMHFEIVMKKRSLKCRIKYHVEYLKIFISKHILYNSKASTAQQLLRKKMLIVYQS